jgi:ABC-type nitrate/sulfonate/bicarbonate transport system substrate-binding protein
MYRTAIVLLAAMTLALTACGSDDEPAASGGTTGDGPSGDSSLLPDVDLPAPEKTSISIGVTGNDPHQYVLEWAEASGVFDAMGIEVTSTFFDSSQRAAQAVIGGQVDILVTNATQVINTLATDQPLVAVGVMINKFPDYIYGASGVTGGGDLEGESIAISEVGGQSYAEVIVALDELGLSPDDVEITPIGGQGARVSALTAGRVKAAPAQAGLEATLAEQGIEPLVKLPEIETPYAGSAIVAQRSFLESNPNTVLNVLAAALVATQLEFSDPDGVASAYAEAYELEEAEATDVWDEYRDSGIAQRDLQSTVEAFENDKEIIALTNEAAADVDASEAWDPSFLEQLDELGFIEALDIPSS